MKTFREMLEATTHIEKAFMVKYDNEVIAAYDTLDKAISSIDTLFKDKKNQDKKFSIFKKGKLDRAYTYSNGVMKIR